MNIVTIVVLIAVGLLGIASWLKSRQPNAAGPLAQLEQVAGWVGIAGLIWGLFIFFKLLSVMQLLMAFAPLTFFLVLASSLVLIALSLILAVPTVRALAGANGFTDGLGRFAEKLAPFKMILGFICLGLAVYTLLSTVFGF